jgi:hypothetical protein
MKNLKIQQEILKAVLANPENIATREIIGSHINDTGELVSINGTVGWLIPINTLCVMTADAKGLPFIDFDDIVRPENLLIGTDDYKRGGTARRYTRTEEHILEPDVYTDQSLLKYFDSPTLYQDPHNRYSVIAVTEHPWEENRDVLVGFVMPVNVKEENT